jgi:hypothetical protein
LTPLSAIYDDRFSGIAVALRKCMGNFSTLAIFALADSKTFTLPAGIDMLDISAIALIFFFLIGRIAKRKQNRLCKSASKPSSSTRTPDHFFKNKHAAALKPCPNCAEQLMLSALVCDACDYNFLAARPARQKLLPPSSPTTHETSNQSIASG